MYTTRLPARHVKVEDCSFHDCRRAVKFEHSGEQDGHPGDPIGGIDLAGTHNVRIKDCRFDIAGVGGDEGYSLLTPTAIWIESEGIYNERVDNCQVQGTREGLEAGLCFLTSCHDTGMGIAFGDPNQAVTVVNGIVYYNTGDDPGPGDVFAGSISCCDRATGFYNGGGNDLHGCISDEPLFKDGRFHLSCQDEQYLSPCIDDGDDAAAPQGIAVITNPEQVEIL